MRGKRAGPIHRTALDNLGQVARLANDALTCVKSGRDLAYKEEHFFLDWEYPLTRMTENVDDYTCDECGETCA